MTAAVVMGVEKAMIVMKVAMETLRYGREGGRSIVVVLVIVP